MSPQAGRGQGGPGRGQGTIGAIPVANVPPLAADEPVIEMDQEWTPSLSTNATGGAVVDQGLLPE